MDRIAFRNHVRFLGSDGIASNLIQRERLVDRPGNVFDGTNKIYQLNNRRICGFTLYDENGVEVSGSAYTLNSGTGRLVMNTASTSPGMFSDYFFNYLDDTEMDQAISGAAASAVFDPDDVSPAALDFCAAYALAYVYTAAASKASTYYTVSAAGKQVSKSEIFNHFSTLAATMLTKGESLRRDSFTDRGTRDQVGEAHGQSTYAQPYLLDGGA